MEYNSIKPVSHKFFLEKYKGLREPDLKRDENYSPLFDGFMDIVMKTVKELCPEVFTEVVTSSLVPERIASESLRLVEQFIIKQEKIRVK